MKTYLKYVKLNLQDWKFVTFMLVFACITAWQGYTQEDDGANFKILLIVDAIIAVFFFLGCYMNMKEQEQ